MKLILTLLLIIPGFIFSQDTLVIVKNYIPEPDTTLVFSPAEYSGGLPLVILLHGWSGNYKQWSKDADLQKLSDDYNFIIACPDGFYDSWYLDYPLKPNVQFETFFWDDLVPALLGKYSVDSANIFISGLSMGGHGAMVIFLKHPDFFKSAGSTSGILDITEFPDRWGIKNGLGSFDSNPDLWKRNSALYLLKNISGSSKEIIFDCGTEDFAFGVNKKFDEECTKLNVKHKFLKSHGKHSHVYWRKSILKHFEFFKNLIGQKDGK